VGEKDPLSGPDARTSPPRPYHFLANQKCGASAETTTQEIRQKKELERKREGKWLEKSTKANAQAPRDRRRSEAESVTKNERSQRSEEINLRKEVNTPWA